RFPPRRYQVKRSLSLLVAVVTAGVLTMAMTRAFGAEEGAGVSARGGCSLGSEWSLHMGAEVGGRIRARDQFGDPRPDLEGGAPVQQPHSGPDYGDDRRGRRFRDQKGREQLEGNGRGRDPRNQPGDRRDLRWP